MGLLMKVKFILLNSEIAAEGFLYGENLENELEYAGMTSQSGVSVKNFQQAVMELCKAKQIQNCCHPNALMTLKEYLTDYASEATKELGQALIQSELGNVPQEKVREIVQKHLTEIEKGKRDFYF